MSQNTCLPNGAFHGDAAIKQAAIERLHSLRANLSILIPSVEEAGPDMLPPHDVVRWMLGVETRTEACRKAKLVWGFPKCTTRHLIGLARVAENPVGFTLQVFEVIQVGADLRALNAAMDGDIKAEEFVGLLAGARVIQPTPRVQAPMNPYYARKAPQQRFSRLRGLFSGRFFAMGSQ